MNASTRAGRHRDGIAEYQLNMRPVARQNLVGDCYFASGLSSQTTFLSSGLRNDTRL
jgi:hypothetical protein